MPDNYKPDLEQIRVLIDSIDKEIVGLLNKRAGLSLEVGKFKAKTQMPIYSPEREQSLLDALKSNNAGPLPAEHLVRIYTEILSSSRALQKPLCAACLGPAGTFSHLAGQDYLGKSTNIVPLPNLEAVFAAVTDGKTQLGIVPLENSLQGSVGQSLDLFMLHPVHICAEFFYRVRHSLLSLETDIKAIKKVYSHPQPLAQCAGWLNSNLSDAILITADSTAHAASLAAGEKNSAAIGHVNLSAISGLNVLAQGIEDQTNNWTRFMVIAKGEVKDLLPPALPKCESDSGIACKTTILFTLNNKPGALAAVLNTLRDAGLNLSKLESRPALGEEWGYTFFADIDTNILEQPGLVEKLTRNCHFLKLLGVYPLGSKL